MFKALRIAFAVGAAALVVACVFIGIFVGMVAFWCCAAGAVLLFALSLLFRFLQEDREGKHEPETPYIPDVAPAKADSPAEEDGAVREESAEEMPAEDVGTETAGKEELPSNQKKKN